MMLCMFSYEIRSDMNYMLVIFVFAKMIKMTKIILLYFNFYVL